MSFAAALLGVRDYLRTNYPLQNNQCDIEEDEHPAIVVPALFVAVHPLSWFPGPDNDSSLGALDELFSIGCTITMEIGGVPVDRIAQNRWLKAATGIEVVARNLNKLIHKNYTLLDSINASLTPGTDPFIEPLVWQGCSLPRIEDGTWAFAEADAYSYLVLTTSFGRLRRTHNYTSME